MLGRVRGSSSTIFGQSLLTFLADLCEVAYAAPLPPINAKPPPANVLFMFLAVCGGYIMDPVVGAL